MMFLSQTVVGPREVVREGWVKSYGKVETVVIHRNHPQTTLKPTTLHLRPQTLTFILTTVHPLVQSNTGVEETCTIQISTKLLN